MKIINHPRVAPFVYLALAAALAGCQQAPTTPTANAPSRLFLQQVTATSAIVKWRGDARQLCLMDDSGGSTCVLGSQTDGFHREAKLTGLQPDTQYNYRLDRVENRDFHFRTAPKTGTLPTSGSIKFWLLGDSGTASERDKAGNFPHQADAEAVKQGYLNYVNTNPQMAADAILLLGDNAYMEGTDEQWQKSVFELYNPMLSQAALWPTIGNHEMGAQTVTLPGSDKPITYPGTSTSADPNSFATADDPTPRRTPYLDIFTLPSQGEAGGLASGTEQYYSFNYGNVHVVSLDSQLSARDEAQRRTMKDWLTADLQATKLDWTLVIFHHPPYSKSSHDSDTAAVARYRGIDDPMIDMREEFTQVFEDHGVDMVFSGHSHAYERSYYLHGHRGDSQTFDLRQHAEVAADGKPVSGRAGDPYQQISTGSGVDDKVVYTVAGSSGKVSTGSGKLDHPAHIVQPSDPQGRRGLAELGSVLLEASKERLVALFIDDKGQVLDRVEIHRQ